MNSRNIKANIHRKFNEWVNSITDKEVQELVKKNSIVSGGAITSLLLGDKPSDYDIYFTNLETVVKVAGYYLNELVKVGKVKDTTGKNAEVFIKIGEGFNAPIKHINELDFDSLEKKEYHPRVRFYIKSVGVISEESVENYQYFEQITDPNNVDVENFVDEITQAIEQEKLLKDRPPFRPVFCSTNAITLSDRIQIILRFYGQPDEIHNNFDFVHTKNYWVSETNYLTLKTKALEATINKQLVYEGSVYPLASMFRIRKFLNKGWYINAADMLKIAFQISELDLKDVKVLEDQLMGVDVAYFRAMVKYLKEEIAKDPTKVMGFHYLSSLLEKVF